LTKQARRQLLKIGGFVTETRGEIFIKVRCSVDMMRFVIGCKLCIYDDGNCVNSTA